MIDYVFFFSSRRRHTRFLPVSWARRCVQETEIEPPKEQTNEDQEEVKQEVSLSKRKSKQDLSESDVLSNNEDSGFYYCTNLDLVIVQEPCIMCAMALVHSRVRRVYYSIRSQGVGQSGLYGGLNEDLQINNLGSLNHKYLVYRGILEEKVKEKYKSLNGDNQNV
eukprot:TRINITY_DN2751_c0_g1_i3.p2 TRINITY_DN2751_c0_g1~~TRINITY_DN2751_c0_g1_i3.p2  ORF type:complete len:165 (+),score=48.21 TRINITY_DN2751_c0_g1_i3:2-496(+)